MCGIVGIVHWQGESAGYAQLVERMVDSVQRRGPDGKGLHSFSSATLGHARLSIIDVSGGSQPMIGKGEEVGLTFNGEIYNYKDLKNKIDYPFLTNSDSEVLLALYETKTPDFVSKLSGMFAFAIWDEKKQELYCARDRFGEKPFYYAMGKGGEFIFSSELKSILQTGLVDDKLDKESLAHYLQRLYVPANRTIYQKINVLPPAHELIVAKNDLKLRRFWNIPKQENINFGDATHIFNDLLDKAVERQLVADVEVGALLSGGLDSTTVVATMSKYRRKIKTFSFGFAGEQNELGFARDVAKKYNTEHIEFIEDNFEVSDLVLEMAKVYQEPFADSSNIPTYLISKCASSYLKVALTGDGADELLGGYTSWYKPLTYFSADVSNSKANGLRMLLKICSVLKVNWSHGLELGAAQNLKRRFGSIANARLGQEHFFSDAEILNFGLEPHRKVFTFTETNTLNDALYVDTLDYLPGDILTKTDRAAMANGLELRAPFLDADLAEFCLSLPSEFKIDKEADKKLLRHACSTYWPKSVQGRSKQGFGADVGKWLKQEKMIQLSEYFLNSPERKVYEIIDYNLVQKLLKIDNPYRKWILLNFSIWLEENKFSI